MFSPLFFTSTHSITTSKRELPAIEPNIFHKRLRASAHTREEKGTRNHGELDNKTHCAPHNREHLLENNHQSCHHSLVRWPIFFGVVWCLPIGTQPTRKKRKKFEKCRPSHSHMKYDFSTFLSSHSIFLNIARLGPLSCIKYMSQNDKGSPAKLCNFEKFEFSQSRRRKEGEVRMDPKSL